MDVAVTSWDLAESPFNSVIGTNHVPSSAEMANIKTFISESQRERSRLESEVRRLQAVLHKSSEFIEAHRALISPIRQLPPETLAEIFVWCLPTDIGYSVRSLKQAPLIFTTVCRTWRNVALGTPRLWNSLHIYLPPNLTDEAFFEREAGISLWLERSGSLPLSISFHGRTSHVASYGVDENMTKQHMASFFRSIMQLCNRTVDLSLSLSPRDYVLLEQICPPQLPVLTSLSLRDANLHEGIFDHLDEGPTEISFTSLFQRMPALKKLQVKEFAIRGSSSYTFCIQTLTSIDLSADGTGSFGVLVDVVQGLSLLSQMPKLQFIRMTVQLGVGTDEETTPLPTVQFGHLEELRLTFVRRSRPLQRDRMTAFFESLQCHSLRTLSMSWQGSLISDIPFRALPLYSVETLELNITLVSESLLECLTLTPNLKSLSFRATDCRSDTTPTAFVYCSLEDLHLLALTRSSQNPTPLCPRLRSFQYLEKNQGRSSGDLVSTAVLTEFIQSREGTLERCDMLFPAMPLFKEEELVRLKGIKMNGGMRLKLCSAKPYWMTKLDAPTVGLVPWWQHHLPLRRGYEASGMEGPYGTDEII